MGGLVAKRPTLLLRSELTHLFLAALSGGLVMAAGNVTNDYFDQSVDAIKSPQRPIPSGEISPCQALVFGGVLFVTGIVISSFLGTMLCGLAILATGMLLLYNTILKGFFFLGNLTVSALTFLAFVYGGLAVGEAYLSLIPGVFAFLFHLGREILKDVEDMEADRRMGLRTLAVVSGARNSLIVSGIVFVSLLMVSLVPYIKGVFGTGYLLLLVPGVHLVVIYCFKMLYKNPSRQTLGNISTILKWDMIIGLFCVLVGFYEYYGGW